MARTPKSENNIQVFRGGFPPPDVFAKNAASTCCPGDGVFVTADKLPERVRFDDGLNHLSHLGGVEKISVPLGGSGFSDFERDVIAHINRIGVGATVSVIAIPTYAYLVGVGVRIDAEETGLTFDLITRNGLVIPTNHIRAIATGNLCTITRTREDGTDFFTGFGAMGSAAQIDIFARSGDGEFSLEADELILRVATMPAAGTPVTGAFRLEVSAAYHLTNRAIL